MGKCLSCCKTNPSPDVQCNNEKFTEIGHKSDVISQQPESNADSRIAASGSLETSISIMNSNGETFTNHCAGNVITNSSGGKSAASEKRLFYQKIPPILSSNSSEGKRSSHHSREYSESKINALFEQYKDPSENAILSEGIERLCADLNIKPEEFRTLLLAWKLNAHQMCCFTREEFVEGCKNLRVDSIQGMQSRFPDMLKEIKDPEKFKDLYRFTFRFGLEIGQRVLMSEIAIQLWRLVFFYNEPPILKRWLAFLEKHPNVRSISRDTWNMFLNFSESVGDDLSTYDDTEAWPTLFDDFVEYESDQTNQNVVHSKDKCILDV